MSSGESNRDRKGDDAGFKALEDVIESKIGIPIHYHSMIDFAGFAKAIDTVGGVSVDVPESGTVYEPGMWLLGQHYDLNVQKGKTNFNGIKALAYTRSRYTSARGDFDRSERQRLIMVALKDKIFSAGTYSNPWKVNQLMSDFGGHIRTNLSIDEVMRLYEIGNEIPSNKIASVGLADPPNEYVTTGMIHGQSVVYPKAGLENYKKIQHFVRNRLRDGFLAKEDATVAVYNGTNIAGLAGRTGDDLKSYGYKVSTVADAPTKGIQNTIIVDLRNGEKKYTKRYLENRFSTTATTSMPPGSKINPGNADFVIILGQNEQTRLAN
jgi:LCP family protein required for cell wall assembly